MSTAAVRIALADDHAILRKGLIQIINNFGDMEVVAEAGNGQELVEKIGGLDEKPDVVILDINMPVMNGYHTAQAIRRRWPWIKMLALSMYDNEESIIKMLRSGANGYVLKDVEPADLRIILNHLRTNPFYYSDLVTGRLLHMVQQGEEQHEDITDRELEFLQQCCSELTYKEIAENMFVSPRTIDGYRDSLFRKLQISNRVGLAIYAIKTGLVKV